MNTIFDFGKLYNDFWILIFNHLDDLTILHLAQTCKSAYRAVKTSQIRQRLSYPLKEQYKLTIEQMSCLNNIMKSHDKYKVVFGDVGSGKTFLAITYVMRYYRELLEEGTYKVIFSIPPANVKQWSDTFDKYTNLKVLSNYKSASGYNKEWKMHVEDYDLFLSSYINADKIIKELVGRRKYFLVNVVDEIHNDGTNDLCHECIGFTASKEKFSKGKTSTRYEHVIYYNKMYRHNYATFDLKSSILNADLKPVSYKIYDYTGYNNEQKIDVMFALMGRESMSKRCQNQINRILTFGKALDCAFEFKHGKKTIKYNEGFNFSVRNEMQIKELLLKSPKLCSILTLAQDVKKRGEKLIIFDTRLNELPLLMFILNLYSIETMLFSTIYDPVARSGELEKFKATGTVLLGAVSMLSEGHNLTEANHVLFISCPTSLEAIDQAIGRVNRYPQKKQVYLHIIPACALEKYIYLSNLAENTKKIFLNNIGDFVLEFDKVC